MKKISKKTIERAFVYIRTLKSLLKDKEDYISSQELADILGTTDVQIRKDISYFGKVGIPGKGYEIRELETTLEKFILQKNIVRVVLFGVGNLGTALLKYPEFNKDRIKIIAAFDRDNRKIDKKINGVKIYSLKKVSSVIKKEKVDIGIIAVPKECSQNVANLIVRAGLKGIVNFAPVSIQVPDDVTVKNIDFSIEFLALFCNSNVAKAKQKNL